MKCIVHNIFKTYFKVGVLAYYESVGGCRFQSGSSVTYVVLGYTCANFYAIEISDRR
jgi:hypothetical protein